MQKNAATTNACGVTCQVLFLDNYRGIPKTRKLGDASTFSIVTRIGVPDQLFRLIGCDGVLGVDDPIEFQSLFTSERVFGDDSVIGAAGAFDLASLASIGGRRMSNSENSLSGRLACNLAVSLVWDLAMKLSQFLSSDADGTYWLLGASIFGG